MILWLIVKIQHGCWKTKSVMMLLFLNILKKKNNCWWFPFYTYSLLECESCLWKSKYMRLVRQHSKVAKKLKGSSIQRYRLTNSLTAKCLDEPSNFTTEEGFPPVDQIKAMNDATPDKDFAFVRLLMKELWPKGFGNQTLSGNPSRNSQGRRSGSSKPSKSHTVREVDGALDRKRVKFVKSNDIANLVYFIY